MVWIRLSRIGLCVEIDVKVHVMAVALEDMRAVMVCLCVGRSGVMMYNEM